MENVRIIITKEFLEARKENTNTVLEVGEYEGTVDEGKDERLLINVKLPNGIISHAGLDHEFFLNKAKVIDNTITPISWKQKIKNR